MRSGSSAEHFFLGLLCVRLTKGIKSDCRGRIAGSSKGRSLNKDAPSLDIGITPRRISCVIYSLAPDQSPTYSGSWIWVSENNPSRLLVNRGNLPPTDTSFLNSNYREGAKFFALFLSDGLHETRLPSTLKPMLESTNSEIPAELVSAAIGEAERRGEEVADVPLSALAAAAGISRSTLLRRIGGSRRALEDAVLVEIGQKYGLETPPPPPPPPGQ